MLHLRDGNIEVVTADNTIIELTGPQIADLHDAFHAAIELADADLAERPSGVQPL